MRYADGGGLTAWGAGRAGAVRLQAGVMFEQRPPAGDIAARLRVSRSRGLLGGGAAHGTDARRHVAGAG
jgi:hypothetical protein